MSRQVRAGLERACPGQQGQGPVPLHLKARCREYHEPECEAGRRGFLVFDSQFDLTRI